MMSGRSMCSIQNASLSCVICYSLHCRCSEYALKDPYMEGIVEVRRRNIRGKNLG